MPSRTVSALLLPVVALACAFGQQIAEEDRFDRAREAMVSTQLERRGISDPRVLDAMRSVPRHRFVPPGQRRRAYNDSPLPIGLGQTISQPFIVAFMTQAISPHPDDAVLEIGTGSGYQAAILAQIVKHVYTIEILPQLSEEAQRRFKELGYENIDAKVGDGYLGWNEHAPYDAILVTAAPEHIPPPLVEQLKPGGIMVVPVGGRDEIQALTLVRKALDGKTTTRSLLPVRFVPLVRER
ncbi:MAG: protein-L-isoaspartate(D-aspartate) O-methyltransferase [Acidobacteriota bacterium]